MHVRDAARAASRRSRAATPCRSGCWASRGRSRSAARARSRRAAPPRRLEAAARTAPRPPEAVRERGGAIDDEPRRRDRASRRACDCLGAARRTPRTEARSARPSHCRTPAPSPSTPSRCAKTARSSLALRVGIAVELAASRSCVSASSASGGSAKRRLVGVELDGVRMRRHVIGRHAAAAAARTQVVPGSPSVVSSPSGAIADRHRAAVRVEAFDVGEPHDVGRVRRAARRGVVLDDRRALEEVVDAERRGVARGAARRQHVVGPGEVVARGLGRAGADEDRARRS